MTGIDYGPPTPSVNLSKSGKILKDETANN